jgi:hypothetical protein
MDRKVVPADAKMWIIVRCHSPQQRYQPPEALTLPTLPAVGIARRVGGRRRAEQRLIPTVIL